MNKLKPSIAAIGALMALVAGGLVATSLPSVAADTEVAMPSTAAEHTAEAAKYEQEARDLDAKAARHIDLASGYQARASAGSKQGTSLNSLAEHCKRLAKAYSQAAVEARDMAKMHREMAKTT